MDILGPVISADQFYDDVQPFVDDLTAAFIVKQDETNEMLRLLEKGELSLDQFVNEIAELI